jgi:hypothetical protein
VDDQQPPAAKPRSRTRLIVQTVLSLLLVGPCAQLGGQVVILAVIPQDTSQPNQTALTRNATKPDLPRPYWTVETRRWAVITGAAKESDLPRA